MVPCKKKDEPRRKSRPDPFRFPACRQPAASTESMLRRLRRVGTQILVVTRLVAPVVGREVGPLLDGLLTVLGLRLVQGLGLREPELRRIRRVRPQVLVMPRLIAPVVGREVGSLLDGLLAVLGLRLVLGLGLSEPELRRIRRVRPQVLVMPRLIAPVGGREVGSLLDGPLAGSGLRLVLGLGLREPELRRIRRVRPQVLVMPRLIAAVVGRLVGSLLDGVLPVLGLRPVLGLGLSEPELRGIRRGRPQALVMPRQAAAGSGRVVATG